MNQYVRANRSVPRERSVTKTLAKVNLQSFLAVQNLAAIASTACCRSLAWNRLEGETLDVEAA